MQKILQEYEQEIKTIISDKNYKPPQRGAYITAANKAAKRGYVTFLISEYMDELDVTPTAAMHIFKGVMGRGVSNKYLLEMFGTEERTASNKSDVFNLDLSKYEKTIKSKLKEFEKLLKSIYEHTRLMANQ